VNGSDGYCLQMALPEKPFWLSCFGFAAGCDIPSWNSSADPETWFHPLRLRRRMWHTVLKLKRRSWNLIPSTPAPPPDVTYRLETQAPMLKLDSIHSGFAAGCDIPSWNSSADPETWFHPLRLRRL